MAPFMGFENVDNDAPPPDDLMENADPAMAPIDHPAAIERAFDAIETSLSALVGDTAPPKVLDDARAYLSAAERCINAFVGAPQEVPT